MRKSSSRRLGASAGQLYPSPTFDSATPRIKPPDSVAVTSEFTWTALA